MIQINIKGFLMLNIFFTADYEMYFGKNYYTDTEILFEPTEKLVETFNKTYTNLNEQQKSLLRGYINNVNNSGNFVDYYRSELKNVVIELHTLHKEIPDVITKIKLRETINVLKKQKVTKSITDGQVSALMMTYELIKEIRNVKK